MFAEKNTIGRSCVPASIKDLQNLPFVNLKDYVGKEIKVEGYVFSEGNWGTQVAIIAQGKKINLPKRYAEKFLAFTDEEKKAVIDGKLILKDIKEMNTNNGTTTVFTFADAE